MNRTMTKSIIRVITIILTLVILIPICSPLLAKADAPIIPIEYIEENKAYDMDGELIRDTWGMIMNTDIEYIRTNQDGEIVRRTDDQSDIMKDIAPENIDKGTGKLTIELNDVPADFESDITVALLNMRTTEQIELLLKSKDEYKRTVAIDYGEYSVVEPEDLNILTYYETGDMVELDRKGKADLNLSYKPINNTKVSDPEEISKELGTDVVEDPTEVIQENKWERNIKRIVIIVTALILSSVILIIMKNEKDKKSIDNDIDE